MKMKRMLSIILSCAMLVGSLSVSSAVKVRAEGPEEISPEDISVTWDDSHVYSELTLGKYDTITTYGVKGYEDVPFVSVHEYMNILCEGKEDILIEDGVMKISMYGAEAVIDPEAALAGTEIDILEERSDDARVTGVLKEGGLVYVIEDAGDGWLFVESGDVRGFVRSSDLDRGGAAQAQIDEEGESSLSVASEKIEPSENRATYYSLASVKEGARYNEVREKILDKALSCVGNPYVWGGTSLTNGADCSGFVQTLYSMFGYKIPRVAAAQSTVGTQIPVSDAAPGDLIFFARNGYVYHVAMYAGDGKTVEAYSSQYGIITKELSDRDAVWATRIIED